MALHKPSGDKLNEGIPTFEREYKEKTIQFATFPPSPFLLTAFEKEGDKRYFVIDTWGGDTIDIDDDGTFTQTFTWIAHRAREEEIAHFIEDKDK